MRFIKYSFIILILLLTAAYFTNPDLEKHKSEVKKKVENGMLEALSNQGISKDNIILKSLNDEVFDKMVWNVIENNIQYRNYHIFSISQANYLGENYTISIGFFNYVLVFPQLEKQIEDKINTYIKDNGGLKEFLGF